MNSIHLRSIKITIRKRISKRIVSLIIGAFLTLLVIFPFYISMVYSIKSTTEISANRLALPKNPTLENYYMVIEENKQFTTGLKNSLLTTISTVTVLLVITSMASYILARNNGRFSKLIYNLFLTGVLIPFQCIMLPVYINLYKANLASTLIGFVVARTGLQISISILTVTGFVKTVPRELEEAASIDGCNMLQSFWRIVFPLMTPINVTQMVLNSLFVWNDYNTAVVILRKAESHTLPLAQIMYFNENTSELNLAFAFFTMAMLPILILYLSMQKYVVSGIMSGAVKG